MASGNTTNLGLAVDNIRKNNIANNTHNDRSFNVRASEYPTANMTTPEGGINGRSTIVSGISGSTLQVNNVCYNPGLMTGLHLPINQFPNVPTIGLFYGTFASGVSLGTNTLQLPTVNTIETLDLKDYKGPIMPSTAITAACPNSWYFGSSVIETKKLNLDKIPTSFTGPNRFIAYPSIGPAVHDTFNIVAGGSTISFNLDITKSLGSGKEFTSEGPSTKAADDAYAVSSTLEVVNQSEEEKNNEEKQKREQLIQKLIGVVDKFLPESLNKLKAATFCLLDSNIKELWQKETVIDTSIDKGLGKFGQIVNTVKKVASVVQTVLPVASTVVGFFSPTGKANNIESASINGTEFNFKNYTVTLNHKQRIERLNTYLPEDYKIDYIESTSIKFKDKVFSINEQSPGFNAQLIDVIVQLNQLLPDVEKLVITWDKGIISTIDIIPGLTINNSGIGLIVEPNKFNPIQIALNDLNCFLQGDSALIDSIFEDETTEGGSNPNLLEKLNGYLDTIAGVPDNLSILNLVSDRFLPFPLINEDESINVNGIVDYGVGKVNDILPDWAQIDVDLENQSGSIGPLNISVADGEFKLGLGDLSSLLGKVNILNKIDWIPFLPEVLKDIQVELNFPLSSGLDISLDQSLLGEAVDTDTISNSSEGVVNTEAQPALVLDGSEEPAGGNSSPPTDTEGPEEGVGGDDTIANNSYDTAQAKADSEAEATNKGEPEENGTIITSGLTTDPTKLALADSMQIVERVLKCISDLLQRDSSNNKRKPNASTNVKPYLNQAPKCNTITLKLPALSEEELIKDIGNYQEELEENTSGETTVFPELIEVLPGFVGPIPYEGELVPCKFLEPNKEYIVGPLQCASDSELEQFIKIPEELPNSVFNINSSKLSLPENNNTYKTAKTRIPKRDTIKISLPYSTTTIETSIDLPIEEDITSVNGLKDNIDRTITLRNNKGAVKLLKNKKLLVRILPNKEKTKDNVVTFPSIVIPYTTETEASIISIDIDTPTIDILDTNMDDIDNIQNTDTTIEEKINPITNPIVIPLVTDLITEVIKDNTTNTTFKKGLVTKPTIQRIKNPTTVLNIENSKGSTKAIPNKNNPIKRELPLISNIKVINDYTKEVVYENNPSTDNNALDRRQSGTKKIEFKPSDRLITELEELGIPDANDIVTIVGKLLDSSGEGVLNKYINKRPKYIQSGSILDILDLIMRLSLLDQAQVWGAVINTLIPKNSTILTQTKSFISNKVPLGCSRLSNLFNTLNGTQENLDEFIINYLGYPRVDAIRVLNDPKYIIGYLLETNPRLVPAMEYLMLGDISKFFNELIHYKLGIDTIQEGLYSNINSLVSTAYGIPN